MSFRWASIRSYAELLWRLFSVRSQGNPRGEPVPVDLANPSEITPPLKRIPLYAIVIGINNYDDSSMAKLYGSVPDATAFREYLLVDLKVPSDQIAFLCNSDASRANILAAFEALKRDKRIQKDDPIVIYYAGHGGELVREKSGQIQVIYPQDYNPPTIPAIPDRKIAALLNGLSKTHGNNITVIFDCCHSGSGTRGDDPTAIVRGATLTEAGLPPDDDPEMQATDGTRGIKVAEGFAHRGIRSHVLLAACSANEKAHEDAGIARGRFTVALLKLLRSTGAEQLAYADVLCRIDPILGQNPQCEGYYRNRIFFDAKVTSPSRSCYDVKYDKDKYILYAGSAHGVTKGAEFTLYQDKAAVAAGHSFAVMKAGFAGTAKAGSGGIEAFTTLLTPTTDTATTPPLGTEGRAVAIQTKIGMAEDFLLHVPLQENCLPVFKAVVDELQGTGSSPCRVTLVPREKAQMEMILDQKGFTLATLDSRLVPHGISRLPHTLDPLVDATKMRRVLRAAAHYTFHLNHTQANNLIQKKIDVQFKQLFASGDWDDDGLPVVTPDDTNLILGEKVDFVPEEDGMYGFEITNGTPWNLHFHCIYFDSMDLSITALTPIANRGQFTQDFMLPGKGGKAAIGYGPLAISPISFDPVPEGLDAAAGFFKFYFTTEPLDLSHVPQTTPFDDVRGVTRVHQQSPSTWGTIVLPVIQRRESR